MIKISALNDEEYTESGNVDNGAGEKQEQIALQEYSRALDLQRKGNPKDATQLLKDLLDTELLYEVKKPAPGTKVVGPLLNLKYLCYKNLALMLASAGEIDGAIDAYCAASDLDDTDITLWYRLGQLCMREKRYEMALYAFQKGVMCNPRHWPCLDKIVTLLLGLGFKEECITTIYDTFQLDPGYLRGLVYAKHIYTEYPYVRDYMKYLNPIYEWNDKDDELIEKDRMKADELIKEAMEIHVQFVEQQKAQQVNQYTTTPDLKLKKPITEFTWQSLGDSLVHMHHYMTDNLFSHASYIELVFEQVEKATPMEVVEEENPSEIQEEDKEKELTENTVEVTSVAEKAKNESENENNNSDRDKTATEMKKVDSDIEAVPTDATAEQNEDRAIEKPKRKAKVRRRCSDLSNLEQWKWCKTKIGRKKTVHTNREDIYDKLRKLVPNCLSPENIEKKDNENRESLSLAEDLDKLFSDDPFLETETNKYFGTDKEEKDVKEFINKYTENKRDIIDMLREFLITLTAKWRIKWPEALQQIFIDANKCYNFHVDIPACVDDNKEELIHYTNINLLMEEFSINKKLNSTTEVKESHELNVVDPISLILYSKPYIFTGTECLELILRHLWAKMHIHLINMHEDFALDCLYQLLCEFEAMGEHHDLYCLELVNFTYKPNINEAEILDNIKFLEMKKKLSTVMDLFQKSSYEEVLAIVLDSFEFCKSWHDTSKGKEALPLDFAVHLSIILDTYWALHNVENCFKWSFICLHEALKHYFRYTSSAPEYEKWTLTVVKVLCCMEHILSTEGLACLNSISPKELSQGLEDLIRIIGHQVETSGTDMPFGTVAPWIIMHYILQREEDQGRLKVEKSDDCDNIPNSLLLLFIAHEQLGDKKWCYASEGKLLYFLLDTVVPRLRSPALSKCYEQVCQYMEQCVHCLFGHPDLKKLNKMKYLSNHEVPAQKLSWERAQQVYEIYRPLELPGLVGKNSGISTETVQLFHNILPMLHPETDLQKYVAGVKKYIKGIEDTLPEVPSLLSYNMRDIYFLLGDYYFKKDDTKMAIKYNILDVVIKNDRSLSWAELALAKAANLELMLLTCKNINNEKEFLNPAKCIIRCFKRALDLDTNDCTMWFEYGVFAYTVHSFCSRVLKQRSESLSMEEFGSLEKQKEDMLDTTQNCFMTVLNNHINSNDGAKVESWLIFYMLGKVAEKRNKPPSVYLDYYLKSVKSLEENNAIYPLKISYNSPPRMCIEVLELQYRMHASILKYIEQHENKPISKSVGKVFTNCIDAWKDGPFSKKPKKDGILETEIESKSDEPIHAANILKRSISDAGEDKTLEAKRMKLESAAAKVRRSASYDTERLVSKESSSIQTEVKETRMVASPVKEMGQSLLSKLDEVKINLDNKQADQPQQKIIEENIDDKSKEESKKKEKEESSSSTSSSSSSDSSSTDSSSDSSSDSSRDSETSSTVCGANSTDAKPLTDEEIMKIVAACLDALEDCASRFPAYYKAIYRLAHYHFYYKKGKDIERCRDLMLSTFMSRSGQKLAGLFSERKNSNFFNNIWKMPVEEVERGGGFAFHMNRSVLLTMEILKEIDDYKTLLDLSLQLQKIPEPDKKYLRDSDREELAQQAFSLCVQSLRGLLTKFSQQADLKTNDVEQQAFKSFMLDIYKAYQRVQKHANSKQLTNLLVEAYKLIAVEPISENVNLVDVCMKFCKYETTATSVDKNQYSQKKQPKQYVEPPKPMPSVVNSTPKRDNRPTAASTSIPAATATAAALPKMSAHEIAAAFQSYLPMLNDPVSTQQTAHALMYLSNMSAFASYPSVQRALQSFLQNPLQNSFQAEFNRQFLSAYLPPPPKKQKRAPKASYTPRSATPQMKPSKSFTFTPKVAQTSVTASLQKSSSAPLGIQKSTSAPLTPSMGTVLPNLPASLTANLPSYGAVHSTPHLAYHDVHSSLLTQAHMSTPTTNTVIHTKPGLPLVQSSPGKTLQEKLAERQKHPSLPKTGLDASTDRHKLASSSKAAQEINASISKLPSSLTITKTSVPKQPIPVKKPEAKKSLPFSQPKPISSDEVIVLDDD